MKQQHRQALAIWLQASKQLEAQQQARLKANEPSARQQRGYVDFREVIKVRTALAKGSRQRLLLAFYTMIPPLRCDLNRVALLQCPASAVCAPQVKSILLTCAWLSRSAQAAVQAALMHAQKQHGGIAVGQKLSSGRMIWIKHFCLHDDTCN